MPVHVVESHRRRSRKSHTLPPVASKYDVTTHTRRPQKSSVHRLTGAVPNQAAAVGTAGLQPLSVKQQQRHIPGGYWDESSSRELAPRPMAGADGGGSACLSDMGRASDTSPSQHGRTTSPESPPSSPRDPGSGRSVSSPTEGRLNSPVDDEVADEDEELERVWQGLSRGKTTRINRALHQLGLDPSTDPRLAILQDALYRADEDDSADGGHVTYAEFRRIVRSNAVVDRAFRGKLVIPDFQALRVDVERMKADTEKNCGGAPASYIPQLATVDVEQYGVSVCTIDGQRFGCGAHDVTFCVQSTMKPLAYAMVVEEVGEAKVHQHVGREPSGMSFNERMLNSKGLPHNPMINAGAIMVSALLRPDLAMSDRWDVVMNTWKRLSNRKPGFANSVYLSESATADRNRCLGYMMKEAKAFPAGTNLKEALEFYFMMCSINVDTEMMAMIAATLANAGVNPLTGDRVFSARTVRNTLSLMASCGMYDCSGSFMFDIGIPCKSGVGGSVMIVIPGVMGLCTFSPALDPLGNSVRGQDFCYSLVSKYPFHMLERSIYARQLDNSSSTADRANKVDPRGARKPDILVADFEMDYIGLRCAAMRGELVWLRQILSRGGSIDHRDFDGRTALHGAAINGHLSCVEYLRALGADPSIRDRFGNTALDDATREDHASCTAALTLAGSSLNDDCITAAPKNPPARRRVNRMHHTVDDSLRFCFRHLQTEHKQSSSCTCSISHLLSCCSVAGIRKDDPRLVQLLLEIPRPSFTLDEFVTAATAATVKPLERDILLRTLTGRLPIPAFAEFEETFQTICKTVHKHETAGDVCHNVSMSGTSPLESPKLTTEAPDSKDADATNVFGVAMCTVAGQRCTYGHVDTEIAIGEISAVLNYCLILDQADTDVHKHIGREPSGRASKALHLSSDDRPHNPLVGAGALLACSMIDPNQQGQLQGERMQQDHCTGAAGAGNADYNRAQGTQPEGWSIGCIDLLRGKYAEAVGASDVNWDAELFQRLNAGGRETASIFCLAYLLLGKGCYPNHSTADGVKQVLDLFFRCEATTMTCDTLACLAATLANGGVCPTTNTRVFSAEAVRNCLAIMYSCGHGDASGDYCFHIGTPSISSSSGCTLIVIPGVTGFCVWSPKLDSLGNSIRAMAFSNLLVSHWPQVHVFEPHLNRMVPDYPETDGKQMNGIAGGEKSPETTRSLDDLNSHQLGLRLDNDQVSIGAKLVSETTTKAQQTSGNNAERIDPTQHPAFISVERAVYSMLSASTQGDVTQICRIQHEHGIGLLTMKDANGRTPMHCAASEGHVSVVRYILSQLQEVDTTGRERAKVLGCRDRWGLTPVGIVSVGGDVKTSGRRPSRRLAAIFEATHM